MHRGAGSCGRCRVELAVTAENTEAALEAKDGG
jgi:hypothetical protein